MNAGNLRSFIEVDKRETKTNEYGEKTISYVPYIQCRCEVIQLAAKIAEINNEKVFPFDLKIKVRHYHKIDDTMRIKYEGKYYRIITIAKDLYRRELVLNVGEINE